MHVPQAFVRNTLTKLVIDQCVEYVKFEVHVLVRTHVDGVIVGIMKPVDWQAGVISTSNTVAVMGLAESVKTAICTSAHQEASTSAVKPVTHLKKGRSRRRWWKGQKGSRRSHTSAALCMACCCSETKCL